MLLSLLAQAAPPADISGVPADFIKNFLIVSAFLGALYGGHRWGRKSSGKANDPVHVHQPLSITEAASFADKKTTATALDKLNATIEAMARENLRSHQHSETRLNEVIAAGAQRELSIITELREMETRITQGVIEECKEIHKRVNPLEKQVGEHESAITALQRRSEEIWAWICKVWDHVTKPKSGK